MSPELFVLGVVVVLGLWLRHLWHVRRYPERNTCTHCQGSGKITSTTFLGFGSTTVRGTCPHCGGDSWIARRRSERH